MNRVGCAAWGAAVIGISLLALLLGAHQVLYEKLLEGQQALQGQGSRTPLAQTRGSLHVPCIPKQRLPLALKFREAAWPSNGSACQQDLTTSWVNVDDDWQMQPQATPGSLGLCVALGSTDTAPYLRHFLSFYRMLGADTIVLYRWNGSAWSADQLREWTQSQFVELIHWPEDLFSDTSIWQRGPLSALEHELLATDPDNYLVDCVARLRDRVQWIASLSPDAFVFPVTAAAHAMPWGSLQRFLATQANTHALHVRGRMFGPPVRMSHDLVLRSATLHASTKNVASAAVFIRASAVQTAARGQWVVHPLFLHAPVTRLAVNNEHLRLNQYSTNISTVGARFDCECRTCDLMVAALQEYLGEPRRSIRYHNEREPSPQSCQCAGQGSSEGQLNANVPSAGVSAQTALQWSLQSRDGNSSWGAPSPLLEAYDDSWACLPYIVRTIRPLAKDASCFAMDVVFTDNNHLELQQIQQRIAEINAISGPRIIWLLTFRSCADLPQFVPNVRCLYVHGVVPTARQLPSRLLLQLAILLLSQHVEISTFYAVLGEQFRPSQGTTFFLGERYVVARHRVRSIEQQKFCRRLLDSCDCRHNFPDVADRPPDLPAEYAFMVFHRPAVSAFIAAVEQHTASPWMVAASLQGEQPVSVLSCYMEYVTTRWPQPTLFVDVG